MGATIGGSDSGAANVISGSRYEGILLGGASCLVEGNRIGTDLAGTVVLGNGRDGIYVGGTGRAGATIGGSASGDANVISGNGFEGISLGGASCLVEGNRIGTDLTGTVALGNGADGISDYGDMGATIGGSASGDANVISGNGYEGILLGGASCLVEGNRIGTDLTGTVALGNGRDGIYVGGTGMGATIGGSASGDANVISGNSGNGINILAPCLVVGNAIGTDLAGTVALGNGLAGISGGGIGDTIGGSASGDANVISGNSGNGINILAPCLVEGNLIGTDTTGTKPVPNHGIGVYLDERSAVATTINTAGAGNIIAFNGGPGVATAPGTIGVTIRFNAIFGNGGLGIDRNDDGVTANTPDGPNNTPVLTSVEGASITGTLNAAPDSSYIVDFYGNPSSDASAARPQGRGYLGSITVATNVQGNVGFDFSDTPIGGEPFVTATATDVSGTTSEFSAPVAFAVTALRTELQRDRGRPVPGYGRQLHK